MLFNMKRPTAEALKNGMVFKTHSEATDFKLNPPARYNPFLITLLRISWSVCSLNKTAKRRNGSSGAKISRPRSRVETSRAKTTQHSDSFKLDSTRPPHLTLAPPSPCASRDRTELKSQRLFVAVDLFRFVLLVFASHAGMPSCPAVRVPSACEMPLQRHCLERASTGVLSNTNPRALSCPRQASGLRADAGDHIEFSLGFQSICRCLHTHGIRALVCVQQGTICRGIPKPQITATHGRVRGLLSCSG